MARKKAAPVPTAYPAKGMLEPQWKACADILADLYAAKDASGRSLSDIFRELPDKKYFPDYYETIPEPECLDNVASRLGQGDFDVPERFFRQIHLVFLNAKHYNEDHSQIWDDAQLLENQIKAAWQAQAAAGVFSNPDPYHKPTARRGRPPKNRDLSGTPAPHITDPSPLGATASSPAVAPSPAPAQTPSAAAASPAPAREPSVMAPATNAQSEKEVVDALDARLPKWPGPQAVLPGPPSIEGVPGSGWWGEGAPDYERTTGGPGHWGQRMKAVCKAVHGYRDIHGYRLAEVFDAMPTVATIPYLSFNSPLAFNSILINVNANRYRSLRDFDMDMARLFEKGRRYFAEGSNEYGRVIVLQRLYNALTAPYPLILPPSGIPEPSRTQFASLPAGPGNARSVHETTQEMRAGAAEQDVGFGITTYRVGTKDRQFTDEARHKGQSFKVGDFVHLINPDDPAKPIIGQVFKTFVPSKGYRTHHATVCWYYRPEQTVHQSDRLFYENEVFKTSHFCDHPVEDIVERVSVQFYVKWIRGKSKAPEYYPGWPNYICHSRYNDRLWLTVRIKNWGSCIPDELRQTDFMNVEPYDRQIEPVQVSSPFHRGIKGPGFFGEPKGKLTEEEEEEEEGSAAQGAGAKSTPAARHMTARQMALQHQQQQQQQIQQQQASVLTAASTGESGIPAYKPPHNPGWSQSPRSISAVLGGPQALDQIAIHEHLPRDTVRLFERDSQGHVLWFSGPPLAPGSIPIPSQASHSLGYLEYLAKRKRGEEVERKVYKRSKVVEDDSTPEVDVDDFWWASGMSEDEVVESLRSVLR